MKLLNMIFSGGQIDKQLAPTLTTNHSEELNPEALQPLHGLASGQAEPIQSFHTSTSETKTDIQQALQQEFGNLDTYELLQSKLNVAELADIYLTLENISNTVRNLNQSQQSSDEHLENWQRQSGLSKIWTKNSKNHRLILKKIKKTILLTSNSNMMKSKV